MKRKIWTNATLTEQAVEKQTKSLKTSKKNLSLYCPFFRESCGATARD